MWLCCNGWINCRLGWILGVLLGINWWWGWGFVNNWEGVCVRKVVNWVSVGLRVVVNWVKLWVSCWWGGVVWEIWLCIIGLSWVRLLVIVGGKLGWCGNGFGMCCRVCNSGGGEGIRFWIGGCSCWGLW